jgi:hypothetical protein
VTRAPASSSAAPLEREWLLRTLLVLQRPRAVFSALRDEDEAAAHARQEPITALVLLAGIAGVLATSVAGHLLDDPSFDGVVVAVWAFLGGGVYGIAAYWLVGALLYGAAYALGGLGSYRRARHVVAFASAPLALSLLVLWPVALAAFGGDLFRTGGSDSGSGGRLLAIAELAFAGWSVALLVAGVRAVHGWTRVRSAATVALALAPVVLFVIVERL